MLVLLLALTACGTESFPLAAKAPTTTPVAPPPTVRGPASTAAPAEGPAEAPAAALPTSASPAATPPPDGATTTPTPAPQPATAFTVAPTTTTTAPPPDAAVPPQLAQAGPAGQAIVVTAAGYGANTATLAAYDRTAGGWQRAYGPYPARVGYNGFAPPGEKREGDGRTPSGAYGFDFFFGVSPDPGVQFAYRRVTPSIVWVDDPPSPLYNQWVDRDRQDPADPDPEPMYQPLAYQHGAVIAYNSSRTPGLGSAIFLHATVGGATAGCVSIPAGPLVELLPWLDPARSPRIVMGVG